MDIGWKNQGSYSFSSCKAKSHIVLLPLFPHKALQWGQAVETEKEGRGVSFKG